VVANASIFAVAGRMRHGVLRADAGAIGAPVEGLPPSSALRCTAGAVSLTQTEGPYYTPNSPQRRDIRDFGISAQTLVVRGRVLDSQCRPLAGAILDFWQVGHDGIYDQHGYRYRGHQYTDSLGRFELVTVPPQPYGAPDRFGGFRTAHIHVKVQGQNTPLLTTQLYLPEARVPNERDSLYDPSLAIEDVPGDGSARHAAFDFVLAGA
jgi:protocatechuate 3,4-dioxygenase beta subunit